MCHQDYIDGYTDGRDKNSPEPNDNRSARYKHSFHIGRVELSGGAIPASISRERIEAWLLFDCHGLFSLVTPLTKFCF